MWWLCVVPALLLAAAATGAGLRADAGAQPWASLFDLADALTPQVLDGAVRPEWLSESFAAQGIGWALASLGWLLLGAVLVALVRPRPAGKV